MSTYPNEPGHTHQQNGSGEASYTRAPYGAGQPSPGPQYGAEQPYAQGSFGQQPFGYGHPGAPVETGPDDRAMAVLAHLSLLIAAVVSAGTLAIVGPLVMWFIYKDRSPFVRQASAGAFNFAIWTGILGVLGWILTASLVGAVIGLPVLLATAVLSIVFPIMGAVRANRGEAYQYPMTPNFLR